jgi:hypothetical protein
MDVVLSIKIPLAMFATSDCAELFDSMASDHPLDGDVNVQYGWTACIHKSPGSDANVSHSNRQLRHICLSSKSLSSVLTSYYETAIVG